jgi:hypothetical protein
MNMEGYTDVNRVPVRTEREAIAIALVEATAKTIVRHGITEYNYATHRQAQLKAALKLADLLVPESWSHQTLTTAWDQLTDAGYIESDRS